jgi:hypothetical protein
MTDRHQLNSGIWMMTLNVAVFFWQINAVDAHESINPV